MFSSYPIRLHLKWNPSNSSANLSPSCPMFDMVWWNVLPAATILHVKPSMHGRTYTLEAPTANTGCMMSYSHRSRYTYQDFCGIFPSMMLLRMLHIVARELGLPKTVPILSVCIQCMLQRGQSEASQAANAQDCLFTVLHCQCLFTVLHCRCLFAVLPSRCLFTALPSHCLFAVLHCSCLFTVLHCHCLFTVLPSHCLFAVLPSRCLFTVLPSCCLFTVLHCRCLFAVLHCSCLFTVLHCRCLFAVLHCCCLFTVLPCRCLSTVLSCHCSHRVAVCKHTHLAAATLCYGVGGFGRKTTSTVWNLHSCNDLYVCS